MSDPSVYEVDMFDSLYTDSDIDVLLSGGVPDDPELSDLASVVEHLGRHLSPESDESEVERFVAQATAARAGTPTAVSPVAAPTISRRRRTLLPRYAGALATLVLLMATSGLAAASDEATPGDTLYGLDRALERVGVGAGGADERLAEATVLVNRGRAADALSHVVEAVGNGDGQEASDALLQAAERVGGLSPGSEKAAEVDASVTSMLEWMSTTDATGKEYGQGVAERARQIGGEKTTSPSNGSGGDQSNGGNGEGNGPPDDVPRGPKGNAEN